MRLIGVLAIIGLAGCEVDPETGLAEIDPEAIGAYEDGASEVEEAAVWDDAGALARDGHDRDDDDDDGHHGHDGHDRDDDDDDGHHGHGHDRDDDDDDGHHGHGHGHDHDDDDGHHGHNDHDGHHRSMAGDPWMEEFDAIDVESLDVEELEALEYADPEL